MYVLLLFSHSFVQLNHWKQLVYCVHVHLLFPLCETLYPGCSTEVDEAASSHYCTIRYSKLDGTILVEAIVETVGVSPQVTDRCFKCVPNVKMS